MPNYIRWFDEIALADVPAVGGKNASLGELRREVGRLGIRVPAGFAITADAYHRAVDDAGLRPRITDLLAGFDKTDTEVLAARAGEVRRLIEQAGLPEDVWREIAAAHDHLCRSEGTDAVAVRSSATAEDLPTASFAGQQESYLNIAGHEALLRRHVGQKQLRLVYSDRPGEPPTRNEEVPEIERRRLSITDDEVLELAAAGVRIEQHYTQRAGRDTPMDIEWAKDGVSGELFIVQARPEAVEARRGTDVIERFVLEERGELLVQGKSVGHRIGAGKARVILDPAHLESFQTGEVLVAETTTPDWEPVMKRAAAVVTARGGRTCHAAIVSRELGIPAVVGAEMATSRIPAGQDVTVSCAEGDDGHVYRGALRHRVEEIEVGALPRPRTHVQMNVGDPSRAFSLAAIPNDGVGLARIEFIINNAIQIHPMALLHPERVTDPEARAKIAELEKSLGAR